MGFAKRFLIVLGLLLCGCSAAGTSGPLEHLSDETLRERARQELLAALTSSDPLIRMHAVEAVKDAMGTAGRGEILQAFVDADPAVRYAAALAAGELRLIESVPQLRRMLAEDKDDHVQVAVIFALHRLGETRFSAGLEQALKSPWPAIRSDAAFVLGRLGEKSAVRILRPALRDSSVEVRLQVAEALWRLGDEEGLKYLVAATLSGHPAHQMVALLGLAGPRDPRVREHVRKGLHSDYLEVQLVAARALGWLGSDEALELALGAVRSSETRQRYLAALALGASGNPRARNALAVLLKDADADVRLASAAGILQLR